MSRPNVVKQIRQYHGVVINADKTIANAGREQIRAAFRCGQLLEKKRVTVRSGHWGRFCKQCGMSEDTAGRYIKLYKSAGLRDLIRKYRTLNSAYQGEAITSPQRQRITVTAVSAALPDSGVKPTLAHRSNGEGTNGSGRVNSARSSRDGNGGIDLKAKVKGGGNLGDLLYKVSPKARAEIESQLEGESNGNGRVTEPHYRQNAETPFGETRLQQAKRLIKELAAVLNQDKSLSPENSEIYIAMAPLSKWHRELRELSRNANGNGPTITHQEGEGDTKETL